VRSNSSRFLILAILALSLGTGLYFYQTAQAASTVWETDLRKPKNPDTYGNVVLDRSTKGGEIMKPVVFPHWVHRAKYTCKVCHTDIGFAFKAGTAEIKMADIQDGKYCGTCHNGKIAFEPIECDRCHSYGTEQTRKITDRLKDMPKDFFGNKVNWVNAAQDGAIKPAASPDGTEEMSGFDMDIILPTTKFKPAPPNVKFPHKAHTDLLDCTSCHESIFKQQQGGNPEMNMMKIISGQYCGVCHLKVAFPIDDCFRCHSEPPPVFPGSEDKKPEVKAPEVKAP